MCRLCLPAGNWLGSCWDFFVFVFIFDCQTQAPYLHLEEKASKLWYKRFSFFFFFFGKRAVSELIITATQKRRRRKREGGLLLTVLPCPGFLEWGAWIWLRVTKARWLEQVVRTGGNAGDIGCFKTSSLCYDPEEGYVSVSSGSKRSSDQSYMPASL